ncbi:MAG: OmpA family protein [Myxococcales bacterium]
MTVPSPQLVTAAPAGPAAAAAPAAQPVVVQLIVAPEDPQSRGMAALSGLELGETLAPVATTSLFFETGQATLSPDGKVKLARIAEVLRRYPALKARIEGNADERGACDYNMDLGARRALAAKEYLLTIKVMPDQVIVRTNGALKPVSKGHDEEAWRVNRRNDVQVVPEGAAGDSNIVEVKVPVSKPAPVTAPEAAAPADGDKGAQTAEEKK